MSVGGVWLHSTASPGCGVSQLVYLASPRLACRRQHARSPYTHAPYVQTYRRQGPSTTTSFNRCLNCLPIAHLFARSVYIMAFCLFVLDRGRLPLLPDQRVLQGGKLPLSACARGEGRDNLRALVERTVLLCKVRNGVRCASPPACIDQTRPDRPCRTRVVCGICPCQYRLNMKLHSRSPPRHRGPPITDACFSILSRKSNISRSSTISRRRRLVGSRTHRQGAPGQTAPSPTASLGRMNKGAPS